MVGRKSDSPRFVVLRTEFRPSVLDLAFPAPGGNVEVKSRLETFAVKRTLDLRGGLLLFVGREEGLFVSRKTGAGRGTETDRSAASILKVSFQALNPTF
jgi:hypothetical protein